jgi:hypothetical protein
MFFVRNYQFYQISGKMLKPKTTHCCIGFLAAKPLSEDLKHPR